MQAAQLSFGGVVSQFGRVVISRPGLILATLFLITAGFSVFDLLNKKGAVVFPSLIVNVVVQYYFVEALLGKAATSEGKTGKYGSLFLAGLLASLGIVAGLILLILPGIFLAARWSLSTPFIIAEGLSGSDALTASWKTTAESRWPLFAIFLLGTVGLVLAFFGIGVLEAVLALQEDGIVASVIANFMTSLWVVGGWVLGVAIYRGLRPAENALEEVFA